MWTMFERDSPRIPVITSSEEIPDDQQHNFDVVVETRGRVSGPFTLLMHSPTVAGRVAELGAYLRFESQLADDELELAIITTARECNCEYEWAAHVPYAREEGVSEAAIDVLSTGSSLNRLDEAEREIVQFGREMFRDHDVSDVTFDAIMERFGNQGVIELTALMGYYAMVAFVLNTFRLEPDPDGPAPPERN